jgi:hypothetical protein
MVLGYRCHADVDTNKLNLTLAVERISSDQFYFGITDRWKESICLFHAIYGGEMQPFELRNNRPTNRTKTDNYRHYEDLDTIFVREAMKVFERRVAQAGCGSLPIENHSIPTNTTEGAEVAAVDQLVNA